MLSNAEKLAQLRAGGEGREALLNPNTNIETFGNTINLAVSGIAENATNLVGNLADRAIRQDKSQIAINRNALNVKDFGSSQLPFDMGEVQIPRPVEMAWEVAKLPFQDYDPKSDSFVEKWHKGAEKSKAELAKKDVLAQQYAGGGAGTVAGELVKALPIMRFGTMSRTTAAFKAGESATDIAKAVSADTIRNVGSMGLSEFALSKTYGESDKEAVEKGASAAAMAGLGTPLIGAGKGIVKAGKVLTEPLTPAEKARVKLETGQNLTMEEAGHLAGGGKPKDLETTPRKQMIDAKADKGEVLPKQKEIKSPDVKKFDISFDDERGRNYAKSWLNSHQDKSTGKAMNIRLPEGDINKDTDGYINSMKRSFKSHLDTTETYGSSDAKFKSSGTMTKTEKKIAEAEFNKDLLFALFKDKRLGKVKRNRIRAQAELLDSKISKVSEKLPADLSEKTEISYKGQEISYQTPSKHNAESVKQFDIWKKANKGYDEGQYTGFETEFAKKHKSEQEMDLVKATEAKLDKGEFLDTIDKVSKDMATKGKTFDIDNIDAKVAHDYQSDIHKITDYINRENDIKLLKAGEIEPREFSFRETKRLDAQYKREKIVGNQFESPEALSEAILAKEKSYKDIGIHKPAEKAEVKPEPVDGIKTSEDKTDYKKLDSILKLKDDALTAYRNGKDIRYKSGDRTGESILTVAQKRDIDEFGDILSNKDILNKTQPRVADSLKQDAIKTAKERAMLKVKFGYTKPDKTRVPGQLEKLGIDFSMLKPKIKFNQTIVDVKNSMGQIGAIITGSPKFAEQVFVKGDAKEFRVLLAEKMSKRLGIPLEKKDVKTPVMITGYGSQKKGTMKAVMEENPWIKTEQQASEFMDVFYEEFGKLAPELKEVMKTLDSVHAGRRNPVYEWTMPDGYKVKFDLSEYKDYIIKDSKGKHLGSVKVRRNTIDKMSRALLPNVFHSIDGYIAREMRKRMNIQTTHDAWHVPKGREQEAELVYRDILKELNNSNIMGDIFEELGHSGWKKSGKLSDEMLSMDRELLDAEHRAGVDEVAEAAKQTPSKQMTEDEVMREFMTQDSIRNHQYFKMVDAMVDEAVQKDMSKATTSDDVYERALAYALQGTQFGKAKMVKPPEAFKGNVDKWYSVQTEIFKEFRAKAELNPDLSGVIKGKRTMFNEQGELLNPVLKTKRQIRSEVLRELNKQQSKLRAMGSDVKVESRAELRKDNVKTSEKIKSGKVNDITNADLDKLELEKSLMPKELSLAEAKAMDEVVVTETMFQKYLQNPLADVASHLKAKYKDTKEYQQYTKLLGVMKNPQKDAEQAGDNLKHFIDDLLKGEKQEDWTVHLFETDASAIREFKNRHEADIFLRDNIDLYDRAKPAIDQLAKAIGREEHQVGAFLNNPSAIAKHYDIPLSRVDELDKIISIKAMEQNKSWDFYEKHYGSDKFNILMDISKSQKDRSLKHFAHSSSMNKYVKGYISEHYDGGKTITEDGKIIWDAESKVETGALDSDLTQNKVGKLEESKIDENLFDSEAQMIDFALKNNLKITDKGWRKIPSGKIKDKAGRKNTLSDRLGTTEASIEKKTAQYNSTVKVLTDEGAYSKLFSTEARDGFIEVTKEQRQRLPYLMQEEVKFVNKEYVDKLLGREELRLSGRFAKTKVGEKVSSKLKEQVGEVRYKVIAENAKHYEEIADRLVTNLVTMFKQNVVLKNPSSYKSALLVNFTTNALIDANVIRAGKNAKASFKIYNDFKQISKELDIARTLGKDSISLKDKLDLATDLAERKALRTKIKKAKEFEARLANNEVKKYLDLGLSINTLDGVRGQSSLLSHLASDITGNRLDKIANEMMFNQRAATGNLTKNVFSYVDFQGRYMAIKSLEANGVSSADAVRRANDLFGQMDDMAPAFVQIIDKYGAFVFAKWFASVAPATMKAAKGNPKKAIALTLGLYYASAETDIMFSNVSPLESIIDMGEAGLTGDSFIWDKKLQPFVIPNVYKDITKQLNYQFDETQHWHDAPAIFFKDRPKEWTTKDGDIVNYKGISQKIGDSITGY